MLDISQETRELKRLALTSIHQIDRKIGAGVLLMSRKTQRFLLLGSRYNEDHRKTMFSFPGGRLEPGETLAFTAFRELFEETDIRVDRLYPFLLHRPPNRLFMTFLALVDGEPDPVLGNVDDHHEFGWFTLSEIEKIVDGYSEERACSGRVSRLFENQDVRTQLHYMSVQLLSDLLYDNPNSITTNDVRKLLLHAEVGPQLPFLGW